MHAPSRIMFIAMLSATLAFPASTFAQLGTDPTVEMAPTDDSSTTTSTTTPATRDGAEAETSTTAGDTTVEQCIGVDGDADADLVCDSAESTGDTDHDGTPNVNDPDDDGDGIPTSQEIGDTDGDTAPDSIEPNTTDTDHDGTMNVADPDDDGDHIATAEEVIDPVLPTDTDSDGTTDALDPDDDNDGTPTVDEDANGDGDPTDDDADHDTIPDALESDTVDTDGDGPANVHDADDDGDGVPTATEHRAEQAAAVSRRSAPAHRGSVSSGGTFLYAHLNVHVAAKASTPKTSTGCTTCDGLRAVLVLTNPNGTERRQGTRYARTIAFADGITRVAFEDKGNDMDHNDVVVRLRRNGCRDATVTVSVDAAWRHRLRLEFWSGNRRVRTIPLTSDSHTAVGHPMRVALDPAARQCTADTVVRTGRTVFSRPGS